MDRFHWKRLRAAQLSRRTMLSGAARAGVGATGLALVGCGDDDDDQVAAQATEPAEVEEQAAQAQAEEQAAQDRTPSEQAQAEEQVVAEVDSGLPSEPAGTLRFTYYIPQDLWDPHWNQNGLTLGFGLAMVHNKLLKWDGPPSDGILAGDLASGPPEFPDSTTAVFDIRPNIFYHDRPPVDGRRFTAEDVVWNIQRQQAEDPRFLRKSNLSAIVQSEAIDETTVRLTLGDPFAPLLSNFAGAWGFMSVAREIVEERGDANAQEGWVGTGPFVWDHYEEGVFAALSRHPNYFLEGQPYVRAIEVTGGGEDPVRAEANFRAGVGDFWGGGGPTLPVKEVLLSEFPELESVTAPAAYYWDLGFNVEQAPYSDPRIRQAISAATDRQAAIDVMLGGGGAPISFVPLALPWGLSLDDLSELPGIPSPSDDDRALAVQLLDAAGYGGDNPLRIEPVHYEFGDTLAESYQADWKAVGIDYELSFLQGPAYLAKRIAKDFGMFIGIDNTQEDVDGHLYGSYFSDAARNYYNFSDPELDELFLQQRRELDRGAREAQVLDLQDRLWDQLPTVPIFNAFASTVWWPYLKNQRVTGFQQHYEFERVWIDAADPAISRRREDDPLL